MRGNCSGCGWDKEIILVTHSSKSAIKNHVDTSFELEAQLENRLKPGLLLEVNTIVPKGVAMVWVRRSEPLGLGHAVLTAKSIIGGNPFVVLLPDVLVDKYNCDLQKDNLAQMIKRFEQTQHSQIMVEPIPEDQVNQYGVVDIDGEKIVPGDSRKIIGMVEKPDLDKAPSNLAITGRYVLSADIWDLLEQTMPGAVGEIQLTDAQHGLDIIKLII
jgi:UTP--glucose-1-phosphate uridylyltransferase